MNEYDGWVIKYSWGYLDGRSFRPNRTDVVKDWDEQSKGHPSLMWRNASRHHGHKIVKVKLMEIRKAEDA